MCPSFKTGICELAGIEPERLQCADKDSCLSGEWEKCKVVIAHYFISTGIAYAKVA
ncbi:MAG: hypothetical protein ABSA46_12000 [Thermodesulfovibrionales bacterium]|jgi:hypothetical protein